MQKNPQRNTSGNICKIAFSSLIQTLLSVLELHQISCQKSDRSRTVTAGWEFCLYHIDKKSPYPEEFPCSFEFIIAQEYIKYKYKLRKRQRLSELRVSSNDLFPQIRYDIIGVT